MTDGFHPVTPISPVPGSKLLSSILFCVLGCLALLRSISPLHAMVESVFFGRGEELVQQCYVNL